MPFANLDSPHTDVDRCREGVPVAETEPERNQSALHVARNHLLEAVHI